MGNKYCVILQVFTQLSIIPVQRLKLREHSRYPCCDQSREFR